MRKHKTAPKGSIFLYVGDVMRMMECGQGTAYKLISQTNAYIVSKGKRPPPAGRTTRKSFLELFDV